MFNIGTPELFLILIVALIVVGPRRLPEIGRTVGRVMNEFRKAQDEVRDMVKFDLSDVAPPSTEPHPGPTRHPTRGFDGHDKGPGGAPIDVDGSSDRPPPTRVPRPAGRRRRRRRERRTRRGRGDRPRSSPGSCGRPSCRGPRHGRGGRTTARGRRGGHRPRAGLPARFGCPPRSPAPRRVPRDRSVAPAWSGGQRRPEVDRIRSTRSRTRAAST